MQTAAAGAGPAVNDRGAGDENQAAVPAAAEQQPNYPPPLRRDAAGLGGAAPRRAAEPPRNAGPPQSPDMIAPRGPAAQEEQPARPPHQMRQLPNDQYLMGVAPPAALEVRAPLGGPPCILSSQLFVLYNRRIV